MKRFNGLIAIMVMVALLLTGCGVSAAQAENSAALSLSQARPEYSVVSSPAQAQPEYSLVSYPAQAQPSDDTEAAPQSAEIAQIAVASSTEVDPIVNSLFQYQPLLLEFLVNDDLVIEPETNGLTISTESGNALCSIVLTPGVQNLGKTVEFIPERIESTLGITGAEITDGYMFGAKAKRSTVQFSLDDGLSGILSITEAIINQSLYEMILIFSEDLSESEAELFLNLIASMNVLSPKNVDKTVKTATYESKYAKVPPAKQTAQIEYVPVTEWVYLPYYYYSDPGDYYDPAFYEPDYNYWSDSDDYWSWGWDDEYDWYFYDEYDYWYDYDYYTDYDYYYDDDWYDYYSEYDPYDEYYYYDDYLTEEYGYGDDFAEYYDSFDDYDYYDYYDYDDYYDDYYYDDYDY
ncbi:MAG: hypothetical protein LBS62_00100 [Clostridiales bacterium]|jgi:hypothetical protein|nr:hypothetical protein [Clostridiales bacterium]